jgi:hypothetical protein
MKAKRAAWGSDVGGVPSPRVFGDTKAIFRGVGAPRLQPNRRNGA